MDTTRTAKPKNDRASVALWHCAGCGVVHLAAGGAVIDLDRNQFGDLTKAVVDLNYPGWEASDNSGFDHASQEIIDIAH